MKLMPVSLYRALKFLSRQEQEEDIKNLLYMSFMKSSFPLSHFLFHHVASWFLGKNSQRGGDFLINN